MPRAEGALPGGSAPQPPCLAFLPRAEGAMPPNPRAWPCCPVQRGVESAVQDNSSVMSCTGVGGQSPLKIEMIFLECVITIFHSHKMTKFSCNVCGVVFANTTMYLRHVAESNHATVQFKVPVAVAANNAQIKLYQAVTALVYTHGFNEVQNTLALLAPAGQAATATATKEKCTKDINAGYFRRDECTCKPCTVQLKAEMQQAEDDFKVWQQEQELELQMERMQQMQAIDDQFLAEWNGLAQSNDYETTESLFD